MYKLVRDNIPEIVKNEDPNSTAIFATVNDANTYAKLLFSKLDEELAEFKENHSLEELADVLTVVNAFRDLCGWTEAELTAAYNEKAAKNGEFKKRTIGIFE